MNRLPPELLHQIVEDCYPYNSPLADYKRRRSTLSSLCLVNRQFRQIAQPLLPQMIMLTSDRDEPALHEERIYRRFTKCVFTQGPYDSESPWQVKFSAFLALRECRMSPGGCSALNPLNGHQNLKRLVIERFNMRIDDSGPFTLPHLEELSLFQTCVTVDVTSTPSPNPSFLSRDRFPSLRALALREYRSKLAGQDGTLPLPIGFLAQLETLVINQFDEPPNNRSLIQSPIPIPFLYDLCYSLLWTNPGRRQPLPSGCLSREYIRIQHPRERIEIQRGEIEAALFLAEDLVNESHVLKVLYLDLVPMDGKYRLDEDLRKRIEHLEDSSRSRKVEIMWEDKGKDFCNSLVSREFWTRSKEIKGRNQR